MKARDILDFLQKNLHFSSKSVDKLRLYVDLLLRYNKKLNLISKTTEKTVWNRHVLDSAQIIQYIPNDAKNIVDFGSGAGLPGLILSIFDDKNKFHVKLYEKSTLKRKFLASVKESLKIDFDILDNVYGNEIEADLIVARAFKKLDEIIRISREIVKKPHKIIVLKGKNAQIEINNVSLGKNYSYKLVNSITDKKSKILLVDAKKNV